MHFRAGSSECWQWGRPLGESWEHSPEQGNLGRKTKVLGGSDTHRSSLSTATTSTFASEAAPPNALLATGPLPAPLPPPQVCGTCSACVPRYQQRGTTSAPSLRKRTPILVSREPQPAERPSLLFLSPQHQSALSFLPCQATSPHQPRYLGALWLALQVPHQWTLLDDSTILHNSRAPLFYMSRSSSGCLRRESVEVKQTTSRGKVQVQGPATPQRLATQKLLPTPIVSRA